MVNQTLYCILANRAKAEKAIQALVDAGANPHDISILSSQGDEFRELESTHKDFNRNWRTEERVTDHPAGTLRDTNESHRKQPSGLGTEKHTKAPEGATTGGLTGGIIGGTLGLLAGIGALAIPGMGPFIAAGPLLGALSGLGAGGTIGGIIGALVGAGIPEYEAKQYENRLKEGGILLSVHVFDDEKAKQWKDILQKLGAEDVTISSVASNGKKFNK